MGIFDFSAVADRAKQLKQLKKPFDASAFQDQRKEDENKVANGEMSVDEFRNKYAGGTTNEFITINGRQYGTGAGAMSGADPLGSMYVTGTALGPLFRAAGNVVKGIIGRAGQKATTTLPATASTRAVTTTGRAATTPRAVIETPAGARPTLPATVQRNLPVQAQRNLPVPTQGSNLPATVGGRGGVPTTTGSRAVTTTVRPTPRVINVEGRVLSSRPLNSRSFWTRWGFPAATGLVAFGGLSQSQDKLERTQMEGSESPITGQDMVELMRKTRDQNSGTTSSSGSGTSGSSAISQQNWDDRFNRAIDKLNIDQLQYLDSQSIAFHPDSKTNQTTSDVVRKLQQAIGTRDDGKWGNKSQAALEAFLSKMPTKEAFKQEHSEYFAPASPVVEETPSAPSQTISPQTSSYQINYNRGNVRDILRNSNYNPYDFTGAQRRALRKYINGDHSQDVSWVDPNSDLYKQWIAPYTTFQKKGGRLVSRNPIKRFQEGGKGLFNQVMNQVKSVTELQQKKSLNQSSNSIRDLQKQLFDIGAFGNISEKKAVDGIMGSVTKKAIQRAQEMGYKVDGNNIRKPGYWEKVMTDLYLATNPNNHQKIVAQSGSESPVTSQDAIKVMKQTRDQNKNKSIKKSSNNVSGLIQQSARATGDMLEGERKNKIYVSDMINNEPYSNVNLQLDSKNGGDSNLGNGYSLNTGQMGNFSTNNPFLTALSDLIVSTGNRIYRTVTGKGPEDFLFKNPDVTLIPESQMRVLRQFYKDKWKRTGQRPTSWRSSDWRQYQGTYTGGNRDISDRVLTTDPYAALEHSLGQWNYKVDENGNVIAYDTYDWNDGETSANQGYYTTARDFMGRNGTKQSETTAQRKKHGRTAARTMKVNLGKIDSYD